MTRPIVAPVDRAGLIGAPMADSAGLTVNIDTAAKTSVYADAIIEAVTAAAKTLGGPDINAALGALMFTQAYLIAKLNREDRRQLLKMMEEQLPPMVAKQVNERIVEEQRRGKS